MTDKHNGLIPYFTVTFYACTEHENVNLGFEYDGPALLALKDDDFAAECSDAAIRTRAIVEDLFADGADLMDRIAESDRFSAAATLDDVKAARAKGGH